MRWVKLKPQRVARHELDGWETPTSILPLQGEEVGCCAAPLVSQHPASVTPDLIRSPRVAWSLTWSAATSSFAGKPDAE